MVTSKHQPSQLEPSASPHIYDSRICLLGEGPLWHPLLHELFWVDLPNNQLLASDGKKTRSWDFGEIVTALGWVDENRLILACESGLSALNLTNGTKTSICAIEQDKANNRSNDGRADPWGGFWISTMEKEAQEGAGAIYRWYQGSLQQITQDLTIPNGICFDKARNRGYYADSAAHLIFSQTLDPGTGWPKGQPEIFLDLSREKIVPDGAIVDAEGCMWSAQWDASRVVRYGPDGSIMTTLDVSTPRPTCPAFGGKDCDSLYLTTAAYGLEEIGEGAIQNGMTLVFPGGFKGVTEPAVNVLS